MLPSMPVIFTRESQDAFGNKLEPTTTFLPQNIITKPPCKLETEILVNGAGTSKESPVEPISTNNNEVGKPKVDVNQLETAFVRSYYSKVRTRFSSSSLLNNKFPQFRMILKSFDPGKETPVDLYRKIEELFGDEHKDIVEEFLLFLKPGQAAEVGRFMDHYVLTQMTSFIVLLQKTIGRKPTVYRKILRAITAINNGSSQDMKCRILPHIRSNPRLMQMFKSMFPDERPPESAYEASTDIINESFIESDKGYDVWEFEPEDKKKQPNCKQGLDSVYLQGRVFLQHGRLLRSACVTYPYSKEPYRVHWKRLAPTAFISSTNSEDDRSTKKNKEACKVPPKKTRKQTKSPTKTAKDVNDNTKKDIKQLKIKSKSVDKRKSDKRNHKELKVTFKIEERPRDAKIEVKSWTREEDKTMLEVLKGAGGSDKVLVRICELLPHRSQTEVKERFCHVMNLLQQMAVNEVT